MPTLALRRTPRPAAMAQTILAVIELRDPLVQQIVDRRVPVTGEMVDEAIHRGLFGWTHRTPKPAYKDGKLPRTDFDLLSLLVALAERRALIKLPNYVPIRPKTKTIGERRVGDRFGHIVELVPNSGAFSFSVRIVDHGIATSDGRGRERSSAPHTYALVGLDGSVRQEVRIEFKPDHEETAFFQRLGVLPRNVNALQHDSAVHFSRRQSLSGAPYLIMKLFLDRIEDEMRHCDTEIVRLKRAGFRSGGSSARSRIVGPTTSIKVETMIATLEHPDFVGSYQAYPTDQAGLQAVVARLQALRQFANRLRFVTRADELAYHLYGYEDRYVNHQWLPDLAWEDENLSVTRPRPTSAMARRLNLGYGFTLWVHRKTGTQHVAAKARR